MTRKRSRLPVRVVSQAGTLSATPPEEGEGAMSYVYPICVAVVLYNGGKVRVHPDQQWSADDPFVLARPDFFSDTPMLTAHSDGYRPVERGTRAPGEARDVRRPEQASGGGKK